MAIDIIARGLASSMLDSNGKIASEKMPTVSKIDDTSNFTPIGRLTDPALVEGKTTEELVLMMLFGIMNPTLIDPKLTINLVSNEVQIANKQTNLKGTLIFDRGAISPEYGTSGLRVGAPTSYSIDNTVIESNSPVQEFDISFVPAVGVNNIIYSVSHEEGEQPKNSVGQDYNTPYPAGTLFETLQIYGVYQLYNANNEEVEFTYFQEEDGEGYQTVMMSESDGQKQSFMVSSLTTVIGIKTFNTLTGEWVWIGGSPEASLDTFDTTIISANDINENTDYILYTHNGSARGERELRVYIENK